MRRRPLFFLGGALFALAGAAPALPNRTLPAPATERYVRGAREAEDAACRKCHARVAGEHERSLHEAAFADPSFARGYAIEPAAFCRSCHAPESSPAAEPDAFARTRGVACVTCHRSDASGEILTGLAASARPAPHPVRRVADFGTRACVACHEFAFPGAAALGARGLMQRTASEHAAAPAKDRSCASCHMAGSGHRFPASRDPALLAAAITVRATREPDGVARFVLEPRDVGHAFPTGDLFRRLVLRLTTKRGVREHAFERTFRSERHGDGAPVRVEASDSRLSGRREVVLPLASAATRWQLVYQRVTASAQTPPFERGIEAETVLASGTL